MIEALKPCEVFLKQIEKLMKNQPSASDLDAADKFMRNLNAMYGRWAQLNGLASSVLAQLTYEAIKGMNEDEYKRIKNSSTLTTEYIHGMNPQSVSLINEVQQVGYILKTTADNYRSLISSYRLEREIDSNTVRNTSNRA